MNLTTRRRDEVRIYSLADCEELLRNAMSGDRTTASFASIGLFCGLRPENELRNLLRSDVHLTESRS
jgi:hypothetical protein